MTTSDTSGEWIAIADIRGVQRFIFETDRLSQMRGGSRLLDDLSTPVAQLTERLGGVLEVAKGGRFEAALPDRAAAERWVAETRTEFRKATRLDRSHISFGIGTSSEEANLRLAEAKRSPTLASAAAHGLFRLCDFCGTRAAETSLLGPEGAVSLVCGVCEARGRAARRAPVGLWQEFGFSGEPTADMSAFAAASRPEGRVALVVADGNDIGALMRRTSDKRQMSVRLSKATEEAVRAAAHVAGTGGLLPLWVGGDDAVFVVHAQHGIEAATAFVLRFEQEMQDAASTPVTMSAAVVVIRASHPFLESHRLGHELLENVKTSVRSPVWRMSTGGIDIEVVDEAVTGSLAQRRIGTRLRPLALRPPANDWGVQRALEVADELLERAAPRSRVYRLKDGQEPPVFGDAAVMDLIDEARRFNRLDTLRVLFELRWEGQAP